MYFVAMLTNSQILIMGISNIEIFIENIDIEDYFFVKVVILV